MVKVTAWKRRLIVQLLLSFKKSGLLNLCQNFDQKQENSSLYACALQVGQKQLRTTGVMAA